jgi:copper chaperone CopZ
VDKRTWIERALFPSLVALGLAFGLALVIDGHRAPERLRERARQQGLQTVDLSIKEIMCTTCRAEMKLALSETKGVADLEANRRGMTVAYDPIRVSPERLVGVIAALGYHASLQRP